MRALLLCTALVTTAQQRPGPLPGVAPTLAVSLTARAVQPGEVVRVDAMAAAPLTGVRVSVFGRSIVSARDGAGTWRALVGIDLETPPGDYPLVVEALLPSGVAATERRVLSVVDKEFPTRTLRVDPRFVTPPAAVRPRIAAEAAHLAVLFGGEDAEPAWPGLLGLPIEGTVVSGFGVRSVFNGEARAPHGGADFASPAGTPVDAPGQGRVVLADDLYFTGGTVVIAHGAGLYSLLAHLSRRDVSTGDRVRRGQRVGAVGATGRATGPHLHWTVRLHTARVDPMSLVAATDAGPQR